MAINTPYPEEPQTPDDERLRDVCEGYGLFTAQELIALMPEVGWEESLQGMIARVVIAKRLKAEEDASDQTAVVVPFRPKRSRVRMTIWRHGHTRLLCHRWLRPTKDFADKPTLLFLTQPKITV